MTKRQEPGRTPEGWVRHIIQRHLVEVMLVGFILFRLYYIQADPSGPYMNTDETHHSCDARKIVLYGTPFYDAHAPSVLMPVFTLVKVPFMALFGVGYAGLRIPSILGEMFAAYLLCRILRQRGEYLSANLVMLFVGVSFFYFSHSRLGIHEPVLMFFTTLTLYCFYYALRTGRTSSYVWTFVWALAVPLTKTSGVFIYGTIGLCLLYKLVFDRGSVNWRGVVLGGAVSLGILLLVAAFWFYPNRAELLSQYRWQVAPPVPSLAASVQRLAVSILVLSPLMSLMCVAAGVKLFDGMLTAPARQDDLQLIMFSWLLCACAPLVYSSLWFPRWMMWLAPPLTVIGIREFLSLASGPRQDAFAQRQVRRALVAAFVVGLLATNVPTYLEYYRTMDFTIARLTPQVEALVGTNVCSGSGFSFFVLSPKINYIATHLVQSNQDCDEIREAYPTPDKTPTFIGWHVDGDPGKFGEIMRQWYAACPEWKAQYKPFALFRRIDYGGAHDMWLVRTNQAPPKLLYINPP